MKFDKLFDEIEGEFGRINFRERLMLRKAYDIMTEKEESKEKSKDFTYEDYQKASDNATYNHYPFWRG